MAAMPIAAMIMPNTMFVMRSGERDMFGGEIGLVILAFLYRRVWEREYGNRLKVRKENRSSRGQDEGHIFANPECEIDGGEVSLSFIVRLAQ